MFPSTLIQKRVRMIRERGAGRPSIRSRGRGLLAAVLAAIVATAAAAPDPSGRPIAERLPEAVAGAQKVVAKVRGVPFPGKVASAILHETDLRRVLGQKLVEDLPAPFPRYAASLAAVGFFDPEPLLEQKLTTLYALSLIHISEPTRPY